MVAFIHKINGVLVRIDTNKFTQTCQKLGKTNSWEYIFLAPNLALFPTASFTARFGGIFREGNIARTVFLASRVCPLPKVGCFDLVAPSG